MREGFVKEEVGVEHEKPVGYMKGPDCLVNEKRGVRVTRVEERKIR